MYILIIFTGEPATLKIHVRFCTYEFYLLEFYEKYLFWGINFDEMYRMICCFIFFKNLNSPKMAHTTRAKIVHMTFLMNL